MLRWRYIVLFFAQAPLKRSLPSPSWETLAIWHHGPRIKLIIEGIWLRWLWWAAKPAGVAWVMRVSDTNPVDLPSLLAFFGVCAADCIGAHAASKRENAINPVAAEALTMLMLKSFYV
jgi:hypothetical protein